MLDDLIDATLARQGLRRCVQVAVTSFAQIVHLLEHSDHAAVLGSRVARPSASGCACSRCPSNCRYRALVCWPARAAHDAGLRWLKDQLLAIAAA